MMMIDEFFAQYKDDQNIWWSLSEGRQSDAFHVAFTRAEAAEQGVGVMILDCMEYGAGECRNIDMIEGLRARAEAAETAVGMMVAAVCPNMEMSHAKPTPLHS